MQRYPLGPFSVSRIGLGAMQLPGPGVFGPPRDPGEALAGLPPPPGDQSIPLARSTWGKPRSPPSSVFPAPGRCLTRSDTARSRSPGSASRPCPDPPPRLKIAKQNRQQRGKHCPGSPESAATGSNTTRAKTSAGSPSSDEFGHDEKLGEDAPKDGVPGKIYRTAALRDSPRSRSGSWVLSWAEGGSPSPSRLAKPAISTATRTTAGEQSRPSLWVAVLASG